MLKPLDSLVDCHASAVPVKVFATGVPLRTLKSYQRPAV